QTVWRLRDPHGRPLTEVGAMIAAAEAASDATRRRECHRHVGDYTLFWTGVYPEALDKMRRAGSADALINYQEQGTRSSYLASTLSDGEPDGPLLRRLSDRFDWSAFGLSCVRREWERFEADGPPAAKPTRPVL